MAESTYGFPHYSPCKSFTTIAILILKWLLEAQEFTVENPDALTPIRHTDLALNVAGLRGVNLGGFSTLALCKLHSNKKIL